ncbi:MAG: type I methionyl aminopeptidase [Candidatus Melainabacteria bacterium]|jgi:methionine aminopeptidase, type I|nr:MAG: type I methionyl aminopeptidase [Candidatus Melainabacteria bacterium]
MITKKSRDEIKRMRHAGHIVALVHQKMKEVVQPGISTKELDDIAMHIIKENRAIPTFLGYCGFPACICTSVNEQVVHGIPSKDVILKEGDIIAIDVGATYGGMVGDSAWSYRVGKVSPEVDELMKVTEESLYAGVEQMRPGNVLDDISKAVEAVANRGGYGIVRQYGGHGVGHEMHEDPFLFNYSVGDNTLIKPNTAIAIEPMLNLGCDDVVVSKTDGWTVSTKDGKPSAHFEHTVIATEDGPLITTQLMN